MCFLPQWQQNNILKYRLFKILSNPCTASRCQSIEDIYILFWKCTIGGRYAVSSGALFLLNLTLAQWGEGLFTPPGQASPILLISKSLSQRFGSRYLILSSQCFFEPLLHSSSDTFLFINVLYTNPQNASASRFSDSKIKLLVVKNTFLLAHHKMTLDLGTINRFIEFAVDLEPWILFQACCW